MPLLGNVLGLDLGTHTIKAVELKQSLRTTEPVQLREHPRVDPEAPVSELLARMFQMHSFSRDNVVCQIPGDRLSTRRLEMPFRDRKRLLAAVPFELEAEIPFPLEDVVVDWTIVGGEPPAAKVAASFVQRGFVADLLGDLEQVGCDPRVLEAEGFALANLAAVFDLPGTRLLIDFGHKKTTFCLLCEGEALAARTIPLGSGQIDEALALDHGWSPQDGERAKCEQGLFQRGFTTTSERAAAVVDRLARETVRTLESLEPLLGGPAEQQVAAIALLGGGARLHRLDEYLSERSGIPAARLSLPVESEGAALVAGGDPLLYAPAIALALRGTSQARTQMNFRQEEFAYRTNFKSFFGADLRPTAALASAASVLMIGSCATSAALEGQRADGVDAQVARLYREVKPDGPLPESPVSSLSSEVQAAQDLASFLGLYGGQHSALDLLGELSRLTPSDLEVKFEEVTIDARSVRIKAIGKGFSDAERLVTALRQSPALKGTRLNGEVTDQRGGKAFSLLIALGDDQRNRS